MTGRRDTFKSRAISLVVLPSKMLAPDPANRLHRYHSPSLLASNQSQQPIGPILRGSIFDADPLPKSTAPPTTATGFAPVTITGAELVTPPASPVLPAETPGSGPLSSRWRPAQAHRQDSYPGSRYPKHPSLWPVRSEMALRPGSSVVTEPGDNDDL
jgi:hypothetical protein